MEQTIQANTNKKTDSGCGSCGTPSCNKVNVWNWLSDIPVATMENDCPFVEVSFQNGTRKEYFLNEHRLDVKTNDLIVVQGTYGFDMGLVSLTGHLVTYQMKKKKINSSVQDSKKAFRKPTAEDLVKWEQKPKREQTILIKSREIAKSLQLDMKISTVELQADGKKCVFYFLANDRVDFRELLKRLVNEFNLKVEMKQIGARQEASMIGGIGSCGKELCCSSWLDEFKSINITAARYQNLSINQVKLSGQCGRLKCCLNYELDAYVEAINLFPKHAELIKTNQGIGKLIKKDIFKKTMTYYFADSTVQKVLDMAEVQRILEENKNGSIPTAVALVASEGKNSNNETTKTGTGFGNVESIKLADLSKRNTKSKHKKPNRSFANSTNKNPMQHKPNS